MTDNEIIKALEYCADEYPNCDECPYDYPSVCYIDLKRDALNFIYRQQAEIDRLKKYNTDVAFKHYNDGIKEFAERVKDICRPFPMYDDYECNTIYHRDIDNLVKEMVGADNAK